ncbi:FecR family protein [Cyclobacterium marinum]|uniref:Anti-FecI sigma factor, FecR n=1 Tax=Cyclobacterium marinum (strain ATCC 25205 / DSM 745 / LMG 13164 / NCIMB 1802) TaxID=880070 RepID=G0J6K4_CYCMS|nr:FecR family protein [Cyclobacterium marinum]AEL28519.1 anti-FecI sigma factor, FecR [Cyclobacterium marinum DSM 745]
MDRKIFNNYIDNKCTEEEYEVISKWIISGKDKEKIKGWLRESWQNLAVEDSMEPSVDFQAILDKVHHEINLKNLPQETKDNKINKIKGWYRKMAATLLLPLIGTLGVLLIKDFYQEQNYFKVKPDEIEIIAPIGARVVVQLSDGTEVHLNYGSSLKYPRIFTGDKRTVSLKGEGFFNVAHDPENPFIVHTSNLSIKALGTSFNVSAYPNDNFVSATLKEGKVVLEKNSKQKEDLILGKMVPGQHVRLDKATGRLTSSKGNIERYYAWKEGKMVFENATIGSIADKLGRKFNVVFDISEEIKDLTYTVTLEDDPLEVILDLMKEVTAIRYTIYPRKKAADGSFSKQKISIEKR